MKRIIANLFWQSPFEALHKHMLKIRECTDMLKPLIEAFILDDRTLIEKRVEEASKLEHEADIIKNEIREHLPHHIFMPVDRSDILRFLKEEDSIADSVEDVARLIEMRETVVPQELKEDLVELADKIWEAVESLEIVTSEIKALSQSSFSRSEEEKISNLIKDVDKKEFEADLLQQKAARKLFSLENKMDPISVLLLMRIMGELGSVADHAQNTGDRLRCIIAR